MYYYKYLNRLLCVVLLCHLLLTQVSIAKFKFNKSVLKTFVGVNLLNKSKHFMDEPLFIGEIVSFCMRRARYIHPAHVQQNKI